MNMAAGGGGGGGGYLLNLVTLANAAHLKPFSEDETQTYHSMERDQK